jgi:RNA polymerase sigma factor (TIGR02999 family)
MSTDADQFFQVLYADLRSAARRQLARGRPGETLNTTALVHEAYVKLVQAGGSGWNDTGHFFALAARAMRQIAIDYARRSAAEKRGGAVVVVSLDGFDVPDLSHAGDLLALDRALERLEALDPELSKIVELRFFAGLTVDEVAEALGVSPRTIKREWRKARAFLFDAIGGRRDDDGGRRAD